MVEFLRLILCRRNYSNGSQVQINLFGVSLVQPCGVTDGPAAEFELFDDVGDLLEPVRVLVVLPLAAADHQERGPLEQQHLVGVCGNTHVHTAGERN